MVSIHFALSPLFEVLQWILFQLEPIIKAPQNANVSQGEEEEEEDLWNWKSLKLHIEFYVIIVPLEMQRVRECKNFCSAQIEWIFSVF